MQYSNWYSELVFSQHLIFKMMEYDIIKKTLAIYSYIWDSQNQNALFDIYLVYYIRLQRYSTLILVLWMMTLKMLEL